MIPSQLLGFGKGRLDEYADKHKLDLVIVYGAEIMSLEQAPGGRTNAKMVVEAQKDLKKLVDFLVIFIFFETGEQGDF